MEHRWSQRQKLCGEVALTEVSTFDQSVILQDLSVGGMGVIIPGVQLPINAFMMVSISIEHPELPSSYRVLAQVVHSRMHYAGLMFVDPSTEMLSMLRRLQNHPEAMQVGAISLASTHPA